MIPVPFDGCAAWLHDAKGGRGAVILPAHGFEELCSRHALRCLADSLAGRGVPTLRFDYRDTGDSAGSDAEPGRPGTWLANADAAIDRLKAVSGVGEVALIGLRLGALLAPFVAARRADVTRLVLLAPPASGAAYRRESRALSLILGSAEEADAADAAPRGLSVAGFRLDEASLAELKTLDLAAIETAPAADILVLAPESARPQARIAERFSALGAEVRQDLFAGYPELMCDPTASQVPSGTLDVIAAWTALDAPPAPRTARPSLAATRLERRDWTERGVVLPSGAVGISCMPASSPPARDAVLFLNAGGIHHAGWGGMNAEMGRRLAISGIASLRLDFPGVGDAAAWTGPRRMTFYDPGTADHVAAALDWLDGEGAASLTIAGACSGAHHGFHAALGDPRVTGLVMLNTLCFVWGPSYALPLNAWKLSRPREMASRHRLAAGEAAQATLFERVIDTSLPVVKGTVRGLMEALKSGLAPLARRHAPEGEARNAVEAGFRALSRRGARIALVYGEDDPGRTELERHMGPNGAWATALPGVSMHLIPDADHALTPAFARKRYSDIVAAFCRDGSTAGRAPRPTPFSARAGVPGPR